MTSSETRSDSPALRGSCECGAVQYKVADAFLYAANCHCSRCRAATGSAFKSFAGIEREELDVTTGADGLLVVGEEHLNDTRCRACGSLLYSVVRDGKYVHVAMGVARRRARHPADLPHLRGLQGTVVRDHRRSPAVRGAREVAAAA